ncbi:aldehyde dehydrogenase family 3 member B1 isoform X2 [Pygocentrus nattereri]|uniref:aldehyde dehydrogenase family 3 member B1 isoform X2 n=1 Tax=Pygocentrus nattereri TaxID=42514 RepID=UPI001890F3C0|nr:aldehyde dehydrogenase family 3 member B1 isoform X2 [Pygocentrus nattereri]
MNSPPSPSPTRWFKALRRTRTGEPCQKSGSSACLDVLKRARAAFRAGRMAPESFRLAQLEALERMLMEHESDFVDALDRDLRKPRFETVMSELMVVKNEALHAASSLKKWMQPQRMERSWATAFDDCMVVSEPLGVVLIVGNWTSPVQLCLVPLVGAIAAGNCVIICPSEVCSHTAELLHRLLPAYLDNECYHSVLAAGHEVPEIVDLKFDHVFFSGTREDGLKAAQAAARTLARTTLLLSGKNPCYVDRQCDINTTARRISWARFQNAGQSAVAPDYVLCHADTHECLVQALRCALQQFYGSEPPPTVLVDVVESDPIMQQDVFGPVLPILSVQSADEAVAFINSRENPLCVYVYSSNSKVISKIMAETCSGSFCSNDSALQSVMVGLPFGGVGASGLGSYHGRYSFDAFSHKKSCLLRSTCIECVTYLRYPPYEDRNLSLATLASSLSLRSQGWCSIL